MIPMTSVLGVLPSTFINIVTSETTRQIKLKFHMKTLMQVCLLIPCGHLLGKGLISWLSFVMPYCDVVTFPLVSWVRCGT